MKTKRLGAFESEAVYNPPVNNQKGFFMASLLGQVTFYLNRTPTSKNFTGVYAAAFESELKSNREIYQTLEKMRRVFQVPFTVMGAPENLNCRNIVPLLATYLNWEDAESAKLDLKINAQKILEENILLNTPLPPPNPIIPPPAIYNKLVELGWSSDLISGSKIRLMETAIFEKVSEGEAKNLRKAFEEYREDNARVQKEYEEDLTAISALEREALPVVYSEWQKSVKTTRAIFEKTKAETGLSLVLHNE